MTFFNESDFDLAHMSGLCSETIATDANFRLLTLSVYVRKLQAADPSVYVRDRTVSAVAPHTRCNGERPEKQTDARSSLPKNDDVITFTRWFPTRRTMLMNVAGFVGMGMFVHDVHTSSSLRTHR